jgi:predicted DNA-binding protein
MTVTTIRLNKAEENMFQSYSNLTGIPMSTLFKEALREKIEDALDLQAGLEALQNLSGETISLAEMMKENGLA